MTFATRFLDVFGPEAFKRDPASCEAALKWMSDNDPDGYAQLNDEAICYLFSDHSRLVFDLRTKLFTQPN